MIKGIYSRKIFASDNGYIIGLFKVESTDEEDLNEYINKTITFTGYFHELLLDDNYTLEGELVVHPRYGHQYQVTNYERLLPTDNEGIIEFLSSSLFKGIGVKLAKRVVDTLGNDAINKITSDPSCLLMTPKITKKQADMIYTTLKTYGSSSEIIVSLTELGFTMKEALTIYHKYHDATISIINDNIYGLIEELDIGFIKIDKVAYELGINHDDERRIKASIIHILKDISFKTGSTYLSLDEIKNNVLKYLNFYIEEYDFNIFLNSLVDENKVVEESGRYYLKKYYDAEVSITNFLRVLTMIKNKNVNIEEYLTDLEDKYNITYNNEQKEAIRSAINNNIVIITGGPGTGKTTIIKAIIEVYKTMHNLSHKDLITDMSLLAPTGRASKRISETTNYPATTIHRFLKWNKEKDEFAVNETNKDNSKLIIIDEVSMIDTLLLDNLLKGLNTNIKLVLVGDYNQLPSVSPGQTLKDLIDSNSIKTVFLNKLYRQSEDSYIPRLASEIKDGLITKHTNNEYSDYEFIETSSYNVMNVVKENIKLMPDAQVMAPMYAGINGIDNLNIEIQSILNPKTNQAEIKYGDVIYRVNDKVLQLVNLPDMDVYNGDIGIIEEIEGKEITINFDGNYVSYKLKDLNMIKHAYAISIHKSQGGEFDHVIIPIVREYSRMLYRKLIYTGITRAKKKLILIGSIDALNTAINNNSEQIRKTTLKKRLMDIN